MVDQRTCPSLMRHTFPVQATVEPVSWPDYMPKGGAPNAAFHGGAILAKAMAQQAQSQTSQQQPSGPERQLWVTRMEYAEEGPVCVRKRCG